MALSAFLVEVMALNRVDLPTFGRPTIPNFITTTAQTESTEGVIEFRQPAPGHEQLRAEVKGKVVEAPPKELELLACLAWHPNRVYTRDQLLDEVWGFEYYGDSRTIDVHVKRLREKLEGASDNGTSRPSGAWAISSRLGNDVPPQYHQPGIFFDHRRGADPGSERDVRHPDSVGSLLCQERRTALNAILNGAPIM